MGSLRRRARRALLSSAIGGCFVLGGSATARAQSPEDLASARALGTEGVHLADTGDCAGAIPKLSAAEKLYHAPTTLERLGECEISVGKLVSGTERLNAVLREPLSAGAPPAFQAARKRAQDALPGALKRIGRLRIHVDGAPPDSVTASIDGTPVPPAMFDGPRPTDPGSHQITATAAGFKPASATAVVADGGDSAVSLTLVKDLAAAQPPVAAAPAAGAPAAAPPPAGAPPPAPAQGSPANVPAIASFVVGGVGVGVGVIFGLLAISTKSTLDGECGPTKKTCANSSDVSALSTNSWVSNVGFGIGIVGAALGTYFLVSHKNESAAASPHVSPWIGLGSAGIGGTFQ